MANPKTLMRDCCWSFSGSIFTDRKVFEAEFEAYQKDIRGIASWDPGHLELQAPQIRVQYECWEGDDQIEPIVTLSAADGVAFSAGELMFLLHNAVVEQLDDIDHHFFEFLTLASQQENGTPPLYRLDCGS
ncbi:hypothetical protein F2P44_22195 [Massilia sp. CCM 8695]|uniref:Uncharacterized protein n=2 Tax=Massilia frigida TaxID=2609281 RepID=A0ABX0NHX9_9BURK|nr:hypothetical protein [Massilia frigida]